MENKKTNIVEIQELVIDGRYCEAFLRLPESIRQTALAVREQVAAATGHIIAAEPDAYKMEIIDALEENQFQKAATLLAAHPDNNPPQAAPAKFQKPQVTADKKRGIPYFQRAPQDKSIAEVEGEMIFPNSCERLADEVFRGNNPRLKAWLDQMQRDSQVPSSATVFDQFIHEKLMRIKNTAERKLRSVPPLPLNHAESNAYYHTGRYADELRAEAEYYIYKRGFAHLVEYVVVELLNLIKDRIDPKLQRVLKSSPEEDLFRGSDIVAEDEDGRWWSVDLTTSQHAEILARKRGHDQHQFVHLPSLKEMLVQKGELDPRERLNAVPIVQQVDRNLVRMITEQYLNSIKSGENKPLLEIFREVAARLGKNDDQASRGLLNLAA